MITGQVQTTKMNDWGFCSYKVNGSWYGSDTKGPPRASEGETVSFEEFQKTGKDGRSWPTVKLATFKKVANTPANNSGVGPSNAGQPSGTGRSGGGYGNNKDTYWADKAKSDGEKDPRIAYFAASERAIAFVDLALRNGAVNAYAKAKDTAKLEILTALVGEQTQRIVAESYAQKVPVIDKAEPVTGDDSEQSEPLKEEEWS